MADRCIVTGVAGFIGSSLADRLVADGLDVIGVDGFTENYARSIKEANLAMLREAAQFSLVEGDLMELDLRRLLDGVTVIFHLAGEPGVRSSWGAPFRRYVERNVLVTQRLLEAAGTLPVKRFVFASSSSIYGDVTRLPVDEDEVPRPISPYGVTKLAAEHLTSVYGRNGLTPTVALRYFTVYGPRQRPDMAFHRFIWGMLSNAQLTLHGDGEQTRDFTFVDDVVDATMAAGLGAEVGVQWGRTYNVGGGSRVSLNAVIGALERIIGKPARLAHQPDQPGDVRHTYADCSAARADLGFAPKHDLESGLAAEVAWMRATMTP
jgi:UDP-glucose 4-epimerase